MTPGMVALFAVACGVSAANLYYAQPLLPQIARTFGSGSGETALVVTAAQVGYGFGLALIVPLGDMLVRRRLVPGLLVAAAARPVHRRVRPQHRGAHRSRGGGRCQSVVAQMLVPYAATLADDDQRGRVSGR